MVKITFNRYLLFNNFEKNETSVLKYYRRYDIQEFNEYIQKMKFVVNKKVVDKTKPLYDYQKKI